MSAAERRLKLADKHALAGIYVPVGSVFTLVPANTIVFHQPVRQPLALCAALLLFSQPQALAADGEEQAPPGIGPDLEFLEFLGSFETDAGEWIPPSDLMQPDFERLLESARAGPLQMPPAQDNGLTQDNDDSDNADGS